MKTIRPLPERWLLLQMFKYCTTTGSLKYRDDEARELIETDSGYLQVCIKGIKYRAHRVIFKMVTGREPQGLIDHRDLNRKNNRFENFREASDSQSSQHRSLSKRNTTGYKGVYLEKRSQRYVARITVNGARRELGYYPTAQEAHAAYCLAAIKDHKQFARFA